MLAETGASHVSLHNFFGLQKANTDNIAKLLASLKKHSKPVQPAELGIIGKEHLFASWKRRAAIRRRSPTIEARRDQRHAPGDRVRLRHSRADCTAGGRAPSRKIITGVNWSPGINNPFRQLGRSGEGFDGILAEVRANTSEPVIAVLHVACPRVAYTDRGKSAIVVEGDIEMTNKKNDAAWLPTSPAPSAKAPRSGPRRARPRSAGQLRAYTVDNA